MTETAPNSLLMGLLNPPQEPGNQPNFKIDQVAFAAKHSTDVSQIKRMFGLEGSDAEWIEDEVLAVGRVAGTLGANRARLLFNYDLGIELEILQYLEGPNYIEHAGIGGTQICHVGMHWNGEGKKPSFGQKIQEVTTVTHTNKFLLERGRKYRYTIFDTLKSRGVYLKVIERLEDHEPPAFVEKGDDPDVVPKEPASVSLPTSVFTGRQNVAYDAGGRSGWAGRPVRDSPQA